ncbi:unnamed protein product [Microthlaspi erraticum]|uniref:Uncharacterized protein n=1 Tax=Microthlaspi erraticum TaxID=1685480 RepID=A0A6D2I7G6_9BRAS|nr:unnamed protein product [Microthlaspi erraticum]
MDFIKTSSLRALIELTFQRNWNGLIWMSRKGVTTKRVKTAPDGSIENSAQPRSPAGRETNVSRSARISPVRLKSRPKSKTDAIMDKEVQEDQPLAEKEDGMEQLVAEERLEAEQLVPEESLAIPTFPITRSRTKALNQAIGKVLSTLNQQEAKPTPLVCLKTLTMG